MDNLNIYTNNKMASQSANKSFLSGPKIIFVILGIVILAEVIYAVKVLSIPTPPPPSSVKSVAPQLSAANISLTAPKLNYTVGEIIPVSVVVDSGGRAIDGVDLIIRFDPLALEVVPGTLTRGKIFSEYPLLAQDAKEGLISISGVSRAKESFTGQGEFALVNLKAKTVGRTTLAIDFQKGTTTASNLVEATTSKNILETVDNLELNIQ